MTESFDEALRRLRLAAGLSQPQLAAVVHFSQSLISKVENGAEPPSHDFARACDRAGSLSSLEAARAAIDSVTEPPHGTDFFDAPRLAGLAGGTYPLRDAEPPAELLTQALASRAPPAT